MIQIDTELKWPPNRRREPTDPDIHWAPQKPFRSRPPKQSANPILCVIVEQFMALPQVLRAINSAGTARRFARVEWTHYRTFGRLSDDDL